MTTDPPPPEETTPFATPHAELSHRPPPTVGPAKAALGNILCLTALLNVAVVSWELLTEPGILPLALMLPPVGGFVAGWRWAGRRPAGLWGLPAALHTLELLLAGLILVWVALFES